MKTNLLKISLSLLIVSFLFAEAPVTGPKYSPATNPVATLLKKERSYLQSKEAPDFWALIPYYVGMHVDHSASAASLSMVLNALKQDTMYTSADEMITSESILKKVKTANWAKKISGKKPVGVDINELTTITQAALATYDLKTSTAEAISIVDASNESIDKVRKLLIENEKTDRNFLIAHYLQSAFTGDPEGAVGTYSPLAAFDAKNERVLILETDRKYYEPYWISLKTFVEGLSGLKNTKTNTPEGGLIRIYTN